jgi:RNA polymerase primary sigma factor
MPRVARFKIAAIAELHRQLEYAPEETRARQMNAAERLIADLDPRQNYPEDFITFRITGYRSDRVDEPVTLVGQALLPDLVNLVQVLSEGLGLPPDYNDRRAVMIADVADRLNVSQKTIQRYRKQGLVCHYISLDDGVQKLACFDDALERFIATNKIQIDRAGSFTRIDQSIENQIIDAARQLRSTDRVSLNEAALQLAEQFQRAHETVRMLLRRHDRRSPEPIFTEAGPLTDKLIRVLHRAWLRGIEPARMAERFGKTKPTIHRAINRRRAELLQHVRFEHVDLPTFKLADAEHVILSAPAVNSGFEPASSRIDVVAIVHQARASASPDLGLEHALIGAYNVLKARANRAVALIDENPRSQAIDSLETDLRWIGMLGWRLTLLGLPAALRRIEQNLGRPLTEHTADVIAGLFAQAVNVVRSAVDELDPSRGQRLERVAGFAMERALAMSDHHHQQSSGRAAARHAVGSIMLPKRVQSGDAIFAALALREDLLMRVNQLGEAERNVIIARYGLRGERPFTFAETARRLGMKPVGVVRVAQRAVRELRRLARDRG